MKLRTVTISLAAVISLGVILTMAADRPLPDLRAAAAKSFESGNWRDAYDIYSRLALDPENRGKALADDFIQGVQCLRNLQQHQEIDAYREAVIAAHSDDWRLLARAAESLLNGQHHGFIVAGDFQRGNQRGGGRMVSSVERDRTRALQLMNSARPIVDQSDDTPADKASFYRAFAGAVSNMRTDSNAWRLQDLTDLAVLPDYDEAYRGWGYSPSTGAPVDDDGQPDFYTIPGDWDSSENDGQRLALVPGTGGPSAAGSAGRHQL